MIERKVWDFMDNHVYFKILKLFGAKGTRFTTEDLARELGTSKRTIYTYFTGKEDMIESTIDFVFREIRQEDAAVLENPKLTVEEKLKNFFQELPDAFQISAIIRHSEDLQRHYPELWEKVNQYLNSLWDEVIRMIEQGIDSGELEKVNTSILRVMLTESLRKFLDYEFAVKSGLSFDSSITAMYDIILYGILRKK